MKPDFQPQEQAQPTLAAVAFGSNQGDSPKIIRGAIGCLKAHPSLTVTAESQWYRTAPIGPPQPDYLNGCLLLHSQQTALETLKSLLHIENQFGRRRTLHWGPRTLDLDLLFFGHQVIHHPQLTLPHPRLQERAFVLIPLNEICPYWIHPESKLSIHDLAAKIDSTKVEIWA